MYERLDGSDIHFNDQPIKSNDIKMKIEFGVLQYTIDDNPAFPLVFSYESQWYDLPATHNAIETPDFYESKNSKKDL